MSSVTKVNGLWTVAFYYGRAARELADCRDVRDQPRRKDAGGSRGGGVERWNSRGRGECVPYARYGETIDGVAAAIAAMAPKFAAGLDRARSRNAAMPAGAARNALDCALWDLEAKRAGQRVLQNWHGCHAEATRHGLYNFASSTPDAMAEAARAAHRPLLKVKLGSAGDPDRIAAVRRAAPNAELIADANEGWTPDNLDAKILRACAAAGVTLVEQPLPASDDAALAAIVRAIPVCADESVHDRASLEWLVGKYDAVNIKLDKTGGLTEALAMAEESRDALNFSIMVGCMVATSLAIAPAILSPSARGVVDLDGPLLLARDRPDGLRYDGSTLYPPDAALWG